MKKNKPFFYLKINTNSEFAISCFNNWVKIVESYGSDYIIVCDNDELKKRVSNENNRGKFIYSFTRAKELLCDVITPFWLNTGAALLTPFLHAKENEIDYFFNIDADDTVMCASPDKCSEILRKVYEFGTKHDIDCFSLDMHSTAFERFYPHWTFGVTLCKTQVDYISKIMKYEHFLSELALERNDLFDDNLDEVFSVLSKCGQIKTSVFYVENLFFRHSNFEIHFCQNQYLSYIELSHFTKILWRLEENEIKNGLIIPKHFIKFDVGLAEIEGRNFLLENKIFSNFTGKRFMSDHFDFDYIVDKIRNKQAKVVLFGAGRDGRRLVVNLNYMNVKVDYFCDNSTEICGTSVMGVKVINFVQLKQLSSDEKIALLISSSSYYSEIINQLKGLNIDILN